MKRYSWERGTYMYEREREREMENERDENLKYLHMKSQFIVSSKSYYGACKKKKQKLR